MECHRSDQGQSVNQREIIIRLFNKNGDKIDEIHPKANVQWEWNRRGGCGQAEITIPEGDDDFINDKLGSGVNVQILTKKDQIESLRYSGKLIRPTRIIQPNFEAVIGFFYGYLIDLASLTVVRDYAGKGIKFIIQDILDKDVLPFSDITYEADDIDDPGYSVEAITFNHIVQDAFITLSGISGNFEWGVDSDKKFFFKATDPNIRNIFVLGDDVVNFYEERKDDGIINTLTLSGANNLTTTIKSSRSVEIHGTKKGNFFDKAINSLSDLNRLGSSLLKAVSSPRRSVKFDIIKEDIFIEQNLPLGAAAVNRKQFRNRPKYGTFKYGKSTKYGNIKRDQFESITYNVHGGAIRTTATLIDDIPNIGDLQKRIEFELREVQRR